MECSCAYTCIRRYSECVVPWGRIGKEVVLWYVSLSMVCDIVVVDHVPLLYVILVFVCVSISAHCMCNSIINVIRANVKTNQMLLQTELT